MAKLTEKQKELIKPFEQAIEQILETVEGASDDELFELLSATLACSDRNCWYVTYQAARVVENFAKNEARRRALQDMGVGKE